MVDASRLSALDNRLAADCTLLGLLGDTRVLAMNNTTLPWLILVPETEQTELYQLPHSMQQAILRLTSECSRLLHDHYDCDKLNIASIGNIVSQMHIHIVARNRQDYCWPDVVWGRVDPEAEQALDKAVLRQQLQTRFGKEFKPI